MVISFPRLGISASLSRLSFAVDLPLTDTPARARLRQRFMATLRYIHKMKISKFDFSAVLSPYILD